MIRRGPALILGAAAAAAPVPAQMPQPADPVMRQLLAESDQVSVRPGAAGGETVEIRTGPRAARVSGLCQRDWLAIERSAAGEGSSVRGIVTRSDFLVLADGAGRPEWGVEYGALEQACRAADPGDPRWFGADNQVLAKRAVTALVGIGDAVAGSGSATIEWRCGGSCPDPAAIDPLVPRWDAVPPRGACQDDIRCHRLLLPHPVCGAWPIEVRMADSVAYRLESARIGPLRQGAECRGETVAKAGTDRSGTP